MQRLFRLTQVKVFFLVLVYVFNFDLFEFSASILEKGLLNPPLPKVAILCGRGCISIGYVAVMSSKAMVGILKSSLVR